MTLGYAPNAAALCARGYDHYVEKNEVKARAYVRKPAPDPRSGGADTPPTPPPTS